VDGFFVDHYRLDPTTCTVLGEKVGDRLDRASKHVYRVESELADTPTTQRTSPLRTIASPSEQRVERRQHKKAVRRHTKRVRMQSEAGFWRAANKWCDENIPTPEDDGTDWSWMLEYASLPYDGVPFLGSDQPKIKTESVAAPAYHSAASSQINEPKIKAESVSPPAHNPAAPSQITEPETNAIPAGFQMVEGMSHAEAYRQGFMAGQNQRTRFQ